MNCKELAQLALDMAAACAVKSDDQSLEKVIAMRNMLRCIASGEFVIVTPAAPPGQCASVPPPTGAEP